jgi:Lar family restriction alleviation protein
MKNSEKFKSTEERRVAYENYCEECGNKHMAITDEFGWLDLEYKEVLKPVLKPCPFCGGIPVLTHNVEIGRSLIYYVRCACGVRTVKASSESVAVEIWNRRIKE